jgi:hypothetical protein
MWLRKRVYGHSFAQYITSFIAFIHIHLIRLRREKKEADLCFIVYEKKGRCFSPSAQKIQVSSTSKQITHGRKGTNILQGMDKFTE